MKACSFCIALLIVLLCLTGCPAPGGDNGGGEKYTVTYDGNGNTGGTVPTDSNVYASGSMVTIPGNPGTLAKTNCTFNGWNTKANGSGTTYTQGETCPIGSANLTLYAKWTSLPTYTVTYDANAATGGIAPIDTTHYLPGQMVTVQGNSGGLTTPGFGFASWNTKPDGSGTTYTPGDTFAMGSANLTLYAILAPAYTVTYNSNTTGTTGTAPIDSTDYLQGATVTVLGTGSLAKSGFALLGWNTLADGTGTTYNTQNPTFIMGSVDVTLYAVWAPVYTVTYNANTTGTTGNVPIDPNTYLQGATVTVLDNVYLAKAGYAVIGWNTQPDGNGTTYNTQNPTFIMGNLDVNLYAIWAVAYTVTYDANGGTEGGGPPKDPNKFYLQNATVTVLGNTGHMDIHGFAFAGWNTRQDGSGTAYAPGDTFSINASVTLYAHWIPLTVTYDGNGNDSGIVPIDSNTHMTGWGVTVMGNPGTLAKTGYTFIGWCMQANGSGTVYLPGQVFIMGPSPVILYAAWTNLPTYTVTYFGNTGVGSPPVDSNNYLPGTKVTVIMPNGLTKAGYGFEGWNTQPDGSGIDIFLEYSPYVQTFTMGSSNVTLYARWYTDCLNFTSINGDTAFSVAVSGVAPASIIVPRAHPMLGSGKTAPVIAIGDRGFKGVTGLTSVTIPATIVSIGVEAFLGCTGLTGLTIPNNVTSIGTGAFMGCSGLTSITLPTSVTSLGSGAFAYCTGVTSVTIPGSLHSIAGAFMGCTGLTSVTIPYGVTNIEAAFDYCTNLTTVTIPNSVTNMNSAFGHCTSLASVTLPDSVTIIDAAFQYCTSLTSVILPGSLTSTGNYTFRGCVNLSSVTLPSSITKIGDALGHTFDGCTSLSSITIPGSVTTIKDQAFVGCTSLTSVTIPGSVSSIGNAAFDNCTGLTSIVINSTTPPTSDAGYWFEGCPNLTAIRVPPASVTAYQEAQYWHEYAYLVVSQ